MLRMKSALPSAWHIVSTQQMIVIIVNNIQSNGSAVPHSAENEPYAFQDRMLDCIYLNVLCGPVTLEQYIQHLRLINGYNQWSPAKN